jgi:hypothetical protein
MAISDSEKLDLLWKKVAFGVSKSDTTAKKAGSNETIASPITIFADNIWTQTKTTDIPAVAPAASTSVVSKLTGANRVKLSVDGTSTLNLTWLAGLGDFIPATFGSSYAVKAYIGDPNTTKSARIFPDQTGEEWVFDSVAGVLTFIGGIPGTKTSPGGNVTVAADGIYVEAYRYVGAKGVAANGAASKNNIVPTIAARDALTGLNAGDTVFVTDASGIATDAASGEWATYTWTGSAFVCTATQDSARSDALTSSVILTPATAASTVLGSIGNGARVVEISVEVTTAFDGTLDITVGDNANLSRLLDGNAIDLSVPGTYVVTPTYRFPTTSETNLVLSVTGTATVGSALVCFTYA